MKRGDAGPASVTLRDGNGSVVDLSVYDTATVLLRRAGSVAVELEGTPGDDGVVTFDSDTLAVGDYQGEIEMLPGPHTYPSDGYFVLSVVADLNP